MIHGSAQNGRSAISRDLKNSFLARGDYNVIITDWSSVSSPYYQYARNKVGTTGIAVSRFIEWLNVNYGTLQVIGYDLGAHVAGIAGKNSARGRISRIIGLDPSKPLVNENTSANRLSIGDGSLVEIFHSNGGQLGIFTPSGDVDYYLNNGRSQPECAGEIILNLTSKKCLKCLLAGSNNDCSHYRAVIIYSRLLTGQNNFVVVPCENIEQVATGCSLDPIEILLEELSPSGIYQINTVNAEALKDQVEIIP